MLTEPMCDILINGIKDTAKLLPPLRNLWNTPWVRKP